MKHSATFRRGSVVFDNPAQAAVDLREGARINVSPVKKSRSNEANNYLFGVVYVYWAALLNKALPPGEAPFSVEDVHDYWTRKLLSRPVKMSTGETVLRAPDPGNRTSVMDSTTFAHYVDHLRDEAAKRDVYIPAPNEREMAD